MQKAQDLYNCASKRQEVLEVEEESILRLVVCRIAAMAM
jgi:hypothetical protein